MSAAENAEHSRFAVYRARKAGRDTPGRQLAPHGEAGAWQRHQRAGEPLCPACEAGYRAHQAEQYRKRKARKS